MYVHTIDLNGHHCLFSNIFQHILFCVLQKKVKWFWKELKVNYPFKQAIYRDILRVKKEQVSL